MLMARKIMVSFKNIDRENVPLATTPDALEFQRWAHAAWNQAFLDLAAQDPIMRNCVLYTEP